MNREDLHFYIGGERCEAWLYPAAEKPPSAPIVVMAHGLSGTRRDGLGPFAERFAAAGIAAFVFDHRGFGDSGGKADLFSPKRQIEDWHGAIGFARTLPGIDAERLATFGSSMGGGNALAAAAQDARVAAAISQVPLLDLWRQAHRASPRVVARTVLAALTTCVPTSRITPERRDAIIGDLRAAGERLSQFVAWLPTFASRRA